MLSAAVSHLGFLMSTNFSCFSWNVRGLNDRARRNVVKEFIGMEKLIQDEASSWCQAGFTHLRLLLSVFGA